MSAGSRPGTVKRWIPGPGRVQTAKVSVAVWAEGAVMVPLRIFG